MTKIKSVNLPSKTVDIKYIMTNFTEAKVLEFGKGLQSSIANFTDNVLSQTTAREMLDTTSSLIELQKAMKKTERSRQGKTGFLSKIRYFFVDKIDDIKTATGNALQVVSKVENKLREQQDILKEDAKNYEKMQKMSAEYYDALTKTIENGNIKLQEAKEFLKKYNKSKEHSSEVKSAYDYINAFERRLADLKITQGLIESQIPSMEIAKRANLVQHNKIDVIINNTIPIWKQAMVQSLYLAHSEHAANNTKLVTDMTNQLIRDNADFNKETTKKISIENERPIIDMETIEYSNRKMIETLQDLNHIIQEGKANRVRMIERLAKNSLETKQQLEQLVSTEVSDYTVNEGKIDEK